MTRACKFERNCPHGMTGACDCEGGPVHMGAAMMIPCSHISTPSKYTCCVYIDDDDLMPWQGFLYTGHVLTGRLEMLPASVNDGRRQCRLCRGARACLRAMLCADALLMPAFRESCRCLLSSTSRSEFTLIANNDHHLVC